MSDTKLRELERRWKETGAVEDEAAYLLERVRAGLLRRERVELAAYMGHPASMRCFGFRPPAATDICSWLAGVPWAKSVVAWRAALVAIEIAGSRAAERSLDGGGPTLSDLILSIKNWLAWIDADPTGVDKARTAPSFVLDKERGPPPGIAYAIVRDAEDFAGIDELRSEISSNIAKWALGR